MTLPQKFHEGKLYNYASDEIRCNADKEGAEVFEIEVGNWWEVTPVQFLILAHDEASAERTAFQNHPEYCEECDDVPCFCSSEDLED